MSYIKTMKTQASEAGNTITDWPADGVVNFLMPMDEDTGEALDTPTFAGLDITEVINGDVNEASLATNQTGGRNAVAVWAANLSFPSVKPIGSASALFFHVGDIDTSSEALAFGYPGSTDQYIQGARQNGVRCKFKDSEAIYQGPVDEYYTSGAEDQIILCVLDRHNGLVTFREGTNAETVVTELQITKTGTFDWGGFIHNSIQFNKTDGLCILRFEDGLPANYLDMVNDIATELRKGADTLRPDPVRVKWMYNIVGKYL